MPDSFFFHPKMEKTAELPGFLQTAAWWDIDGGVNSWLQFSWVTDTHTHTETWNWLTSDPSLISPHSLFLSNTHTHKLTHTHSYTHFLSDFLSLLSLPHFVNTVSVSFITLPLGYVSYLFFFPSSLLSLFACISYFLSLYTPLSFTCLSPLYFYIFLPFILSVFPPFCSVSALLFLSNPFYSFIFVYFTCSVSILCWWKVDKVIYPLVYNWYFIHLLHYIPEGNIVLFDPKTFIWHLGHTVKI